MDYKAKVLQQCPRAYCRSEKSNKVPTVFILDVPKYYLGFGTTEKEAWRNAYNRIFVLKAEVRF